MQLKDLELEDGRRQAPADWLLSLSWESVSEEQFKRLPASEQLKRIRHSSAHVLATAVTSFSPTAQFAIGPPTESGYFYDIHFDEPFPLEKLDILQEAMGKLAQEQQPFQVAEVRRADAIAYFTHNHQPFKLAILAGLLSDNVTLYRNGDYVDLCAGPHAPHTGYCEHSKLLNVSSAHWRGDHDQVLTRINGTAWATRKDLDHYITFLDEAKARDHRTLGPRLDLFSFHPWAASALWHPKGLTLRRRMTALWNEFLEKYNYVEIWNPLLYKKELFERSGHWEHFSEDMFIFKQANGDPSFALKPMNCPDTMLFYQTKTRSYRDLPLRVAEGQILHRNEIAGSIHGIMRARNFVQDDAHIFLAPEHVQTEVSMLLAMLDQIVSLFDLSYSLKLSTRPEAFMGEAHVWDKAEADLIQALEANGKTYETDPGAGAFYGPKIDCSIKDSLGRQWQCGTIQLDFQLPERFDLRYSAADGTQKRPIVIHRALFGSFERFIAILLEHFAGALPTWLSPVHAVLLPIADAHHAYAAQVATVLKNAGIVTETLTDESLNYRVREAEQMRVPYILVMGGKEESSHAVSVRQLNTKKQRVLPLEEFVVEIKDKIQHRIQDSQVTRLVTPWESDSGDSFQSAY